MAETRRRMSPFAGLRGEDPGAGDSKLTQALAALALVIFLMGLLLVAVSSLKTVPDVVGLPKVQAETALAKAGLAVGPEALKRAAAGQEGKVLAQLPAPGGRVLPGTSVSLTVAEIGAATTTEEIVGDAGAGSSQSPGIALPEWNGNPPRENTIVPYESQALPAGTEVPSVMGMSPSQALSALAAKGLSGSLRQARSTTNVPAGMVVAQKPGAESFVAAGTTVLIYVSAGPPPAGSPYGQAPYN